MTAQIRLDDAVAALDNVEEVSWDARRRASQRLLDEIWNAINGGQRQRFEVENPVSPTPQPMPLYTYPQAEDFQDFRQEWLNGLAPENSWLPSEFRGAPFRGSVQPHGVEMIWPHDVLHRPMSQYLGLDQNFSPETAVTGRIRPGNVTLGNDNFGLSDVRIQDYIRRQWGR